jgi:type VI secretion system protein ImpM
MVSQEEKPSSHGVGLYGKTPAQPDYVMANLTDPVSLALTEWIDRGCQDLAAAGFPFPPYCVRFVFTAPTLSTAAVGVIGPSQDQIGRRFPIAIFHTISVSTVLRSLAAIAVSYAVFYGEASLLLGEIPNLSQHDLFERYRALRPPTQGQIAEAGKDAGQALVEAGAGDFARRLFGDLAQGKQNYAFNTFMIAASDAAKNPAATAPTVLDCPVDVDIDLLAWLDLAQRVLGWRDQAPSFFWAVEPKPRLLIALGSAPKQIVRYLADPAYSSSKLWPLWTDRTEAIADATAQLTGVTGDVENHPNRSITELFDALQQHHAI